MGCQRTTQVPLPQSKHTLMVRIRRLQSYCDGSYLSVKLCIMILHPYHKSRPAQSVCYRKLLNGLMPCLRPQKRNAKVSKRKLSKISSWSTINMMLNLLPMQKQTCPNMVSIKFVAHQCVQSVANLEKKTLIFEWFAAFYIMLVIWACCIHCLTICIYSCRRYFARPDSGLLAVKIKIGGITAIVVTSNMGKFALSILQTGSVSFGHRLV